MTALFFAENELICSLQYCQTNAKQQKRTGKSAVPQIQRREQDPASSFDYLKNKVRHGNLTLHITFLYCVILYYIIFIRSIAPVGQASWHLPQPTHFE